MKPRMSFNNAKVFHFQAESEHEGDRFEQHADEVADAVVRGESAEHLLGPEVAATGGGRERAIQQREAPEENVLDVTERFVGVEPRMLKAGGMLIGVGAEVADPPRPEFVAGLKAWQARHGLVPSGSLNKDTLLELRKKQNESKNIPGTPPDPSVDVFDLKKPTPTARPMSNQSGGRTHDTGEGSRALIKPHVFVGKPIAGGVHSYLIDRLKRAEAFLKGQLGALLADPTERATLEARGVTDDSPASLKTWLGVKEDHTGWRRGVAQGYHRYGLAIDVNRNINAWHPVRTGQAIGGEGKASGLSAFDAAALVVIDRANVFMRKARAELHAEDRGLADRPGDTAAAVRRFGDASKAVADYFALAFEAHDDLLKWGKAPTDGSAHLPTNLVPLPKAQALKNIENIAATVHGGSWPRSAPAMLEIVRRDLFPLARQMAKGTMSPRPSETKNPLRGFVDLDKRLAAAMTEQGGLGWGGCEFGVGQSGDSMHFDTGKVPPEALGEQTPPKTQGGEP